MKKRTKIIRNKVDIQQDLSELNLFKRRKGKNQIETKDGILNIECEDNPVPEKDVIVETDKKDMEESESIVSYNKYIKFTSVIDQQQVICKDYFKTGYCGFGSSCKFLHTRDKSDCSFYTEKNTLNQDKNDESKQESVAEESNICKICNKEFTKPVITLCSHIFCSKCATKRYISIKTCAVCGKDTKGSFKAYEK